MTVVVTDRHHMHITEIEHQPMYHRLKAKYVRDVSSETTIFCRCQNNNVVQVYLSSKLCNYDISWVGNLHL